MKKQFNISTIRKIALLITVSMSALSCVKDNNFSTPQVSCNEPDIVANTTINQLKQMVSYGGPQIIENDLVIEGYVVSSDESGNIYKTLSIQDQPENPTAAIKIAIDQSNLYTQFNLGRKIYVKLKGLAVGYSYGSIQIGQSVNNNLDRISSFEINNHIFRSCETANLVPKKVTIADLNDNLLEMLIQIDNVQFIDSEIGNSFANPNNTETVNRILQSVDNNCNETGKVEIRNSGFADFKSELLPTGKGSVVGVFSNYYSDYQVYLRDENDLNFSEDRCDMASHLTPNITLEAIKNMYQGTTVEFGNNNQYVTEGYVISTDLSGNFQKKLVIQDKEENPTSGIQLLIDKNNLYSEFNVGDKVLLKLDNLYMDKINGALTIGYAKNGSVTKIPEEDYLNFIFKSQENSAITPTEIEISDTKNSQYINTLVTVKNVQLVANELGKAFAYYSGTDSAVRTLETCNNPDKLSVFTNGTANFAHDKFPENHGKITGVLTDQLEMRSINDIDFNAPFEVCQVIIPKIMITEVADPKNSTSSRFVELYNAGSTTIDLSGWKLNKYVNGSTNVSSSPVDLTGQTIAPNDFVIIANSGYAAMFSDTPNITSSYISGNGDDVYELVDNTGTTVDIYGVIGFDGNGTNWEYLDGKAVRNTNISEPNTTFSASEWTIYSDANNSSINYPNTPQNAPTDFNPRVR
ncbi:MAG: DUF5689 domain-containing protein [Lutibacter sp.]